MLGLAVLVLASVVQAAGAPVPLRAGDYAAAEFTCATVPFAGLMHYDGRNFSGPHESRCNSATRKHHGADYLVATTCRALGDGTPAAASTVTRLYRVLSPTRVSIASAIGGPRQTYSRCAKPLS